MRADRAAAPRAQPSRIPEADWAEIRALATSALSRQMRLSGSLLVGEDPAVARALVREKDAFREAERIATERHLRRLREEPPASVEASALHLDLLRDLQAHRRPPHGAGLPDPGGAGRGCGRAG